MSDWYQGANRFERVGDAIERNRLSALVAITPENARYLSGRSNFIAEHWRVAGLAAAGIGRGDRRGSVSGDYGGDPAVESSYPVFHYRLWTESIDVRGLTGGSIAERIVRARTEAPLQRPAQYDLDEVFDRVAELVRCVAPSGGRVGFDFEEVDAPAIDRLHNRLPAYELLDTTGVFDDLRTIKDDDEIAHLRLAGELTELGIADAIAQIEPGVSELQVNAAYQAAVFRIVAADPRFAAFRQAEGVATVAIGADVPHVVSPSRTIKFDMQVDIAGYHSDIGRTVAIDPTIDQRDIHAALLESLRTAEALVKPGCTFAEVFSAGSEAMHRAGFANYNRGHLGHSVGLTQRFEEPPFTAPDEPRTLARNMVLSLELPYYVYGVGSFQLERMLLVTAEGHEALDQLPFDLDLTAWR